MAHCKIVRLGLIDYEQAYALQKELWHQVYTGQCSSALILCRHLPVITLGRRSLRENLLKDPEFLKTKGIAIHQIERGGDVTYHGPGQVTVYPVIDLNSMGRQLRSYLRALEEAVIQVLAGFSVQGIRQEGTSGVWVGQRKIASIGVAIRRWVSWHGFTLNIRENDLVNFSYIRPCGRDTVMTSLETEIKEAVDIDQAAEAVLAACRREIPWLE